MLKKTLKIKSNTTKPEAKDMDAVEAFKKDWTRKCELCNQTPVVNATGMCGPCTFGEASTIGGNW